MATASLVLGILSFFCCWCVGALAAVICGHIALGQINRSGGLETGRGMAMAGLILGYVNILLSLLVVLLQVLLAVAAGGAEPFIYSL